MSIRRKGLIFCVPHSRRLKRGSQANGTGAIGMIYQGEVSNYQISISPSSYPGPNPEFPYTRFVGLNVAMSGGGSAVVFVDFIPTGRSVPDSSIRAGTKPPDLVFDLFAPIDDYAAIVDVVRNESPVGFRFDAHAAPRSKTMV
jgi:hypothetical protein